MASRLSHQSKTPSYIRTEGRRESGPHGKSIERRGVGSEIGSKSQSAIHLLTLVTRYVNFSTLKMEEIRSSETSATQDLHGATSQKTASFIVTAVKPQILHKT
jgi:hypothetical protein